MRPVIPAFLLLMTAVSCVGSACQDPLARRFVPHGLLESGPNVDCAVAHVSYDHISHAAIAYANGTEGAFVLVKGDGSDAAVVFASEEPGMLGGSVDVAVEDLDRDGTAEVIATYTSDHGFPWTWVFRYAGGHLTSITPPHGHDAEWSAFADVTFVDFDGDGRKDAVNREVVDVTRESPDHGPLPTVAQSVYTWSDSHFAITPRALVFFDSYTRRTAQPRAVVSTFDFNGDDSARTLRIVNGGTSGVPATSATVILNGLALATPDTFKRQQRAVDIPIRLLAGENTISVEIAGEPNATLAIFVY
ncbi:MAG TPA: VCBS repeat-containing protein [Thermoanaerobaculia bacterium]|nr:VCBS repeat-containing protein [Thermoanaerobaculia bacterium]